MDVCGNEDYLARLTLHHVIEPADAVFGRLQELAEPVDILAAIANASLPDLEPEPERRDRVAERGIGYRLRLDRVDGEAGLASAQALGAHYLTPGHPDWPPCFDDLGPERPIGLWWLGTWLPSGRSPVAAMVGARSCTPYGSYVAGALAAALGRAHIPVASGGALGIDAATHRGALAVGGDTIAFLACGIDRSYPRANETLLQAIRGQGALVSELPPGSHPNRFRFLTRNRLIAALSTATIVVEAAKRSGSLVTARRAADLGRPVLAVPGPITSEFSVGSHELIRDGAQLVESAQHLVAEVAGVTGVADVADAAAEGARATAPRTEKPRAANPLASLGPAEQIVLEALPTARAGGAQVPDLAGATGIEPGAVFAGLGRLAALGLAARTGSGWVLAPGQERVDRRYE